MNPINTALLLALIVSCAFGRSTVDIKVVGGEDAENGQFPHQVSMRNRFSNSHFCGGSIISTRFILTAAHCTQGKNAMPRNVFVIVGALYRTNGGTRMALENIVAHQHYSLLTTKNDISLLKTEERIIFSELVQPIALPTEVPSVAGNVAVTVSGWGRHIFPTPPDSPALPDILQFAPAATISFADCKKRFENTSYAELLSDTNLCTINPKGRGACHGDSGGPLITIEKTLAGVVSWGVPCAHGYPDSYTNVYLYLEWIHGEVAKLGGSLP